MKKMWMSIMLIVFIMAGCSMPKKDITNNPSPTPVGSDSTLQTDRFAGSIEIKPDVETKIENGQIFFVSLDENQSIPYRWNPELSDDSLAVLVHDTVKVGKRNDTSSASLPPPDGAGGEIHVFYFKALNAGKCLINMAWADIRDGDFDIVETYTVQIEE